MLNEKKDSKNKLKGNLIRTAHMETNNSFIKNSNIHKTVTQSERESSLQAQIPYKKEKASMGSINYSFKQPYLTNVTTQA